MKIAIHHTPGSFSDRWIEYCSSKSIDYKLVDCYSTDIILQIKDCDILLWNFYHFKYKDALFAKQLLFSIAQSGKVVFPDFKTCWHFDDKVGQKYLLESIGAPMAPSYIFYSKKEAIEWITNAKFPKVFKLRGGAGSRNVRLVKSKSQAKSLVNVAFGKGFSQFDRIGNLNEQLRMYLEGKTSFLGVIKGLARLLISTEYAKMHSKEKGYIYFQEFIPNNQFDIRVIVIDGKAFAIKRLVRRGDFRASGSGNILFEKENFSIETIRLAFNLADKIESQCVAFDFVYDISGNPLVVEISYGFSVPVYDPCVGYWDKSLQYHAGSFIPQYWMIEAMINKL